eukprot:GEMP01042361.1.p1 GENE.GEMP01042361.1~~GEMP01042361.1.p1  ORF type:complete len:414 (+),score=87.04 GEMP01042361.1:219-1460(+)
MLAWIWLIATCVRGFSVHVVQDKVQHALQARRHLEGKAHLLQSEHASTAITITVPSFYYTTEGIEKQLQGLTANCPRKDIQLHVTANTATQNGQDDVSLTVVRIWTTPKQGDAAKKQMLLVANEHARELITGDSCVYTVKALCDQPEIDSKVRHDAGIALVHTNFTLICNANPTQRRVVENGTNDCQRTNSNGVDLNRNFGRTWEKTADDSELDETYPGTHEFSEAESRIIRDIALGNPPDTFLSIHSGTLAVLATDAFTHEAESNNIKRDKELGIAQNLARRACGHCPNGDASEVLYMAHGTDMDYMYQQFCAFSLAVEIWGPPLQAATINNKRHLDDASVLNFQQQPLKFNLRQRHVHSEKEDKEESCFAIFNPENRADYDDTMTKWTKAYFNYANDVADDQNPRAGCDSK